MFSYLIRQHTISKFLEKNKFSTINLFHNRPVDLVSATENEDRFQEYKEYVASKGNNVEDVSWVDKVLFSSYLQQHQPKRSFRYRLRENALKHSQTAAERVGKSLMSPPLSWKYLNEDDEEMGSENEAENIHGIGSHINDKSLMDNNHHDQDSVFPFQSVTKMEYVSEDRTIPPNFVSEAERCSKAGVNLGDILRGKVTIDDENSAADRMEMIRIEHGKPDPSIPSSNVPCGGCGARLHCQDSAIPGYIPSERFQLHKKRLRGELCLRCYCLKTYDTALNVNISPDDYPKVLRELDKHFAMVLLLVDLTDFPCSIWPGMIDIIGTKRPVFLVGNKVDLIPRDSQKYLQRIENVLYKSAREVGLASAKIIHTSVISATTGFGVEDLITKINHLWGSKGNVFIMGCTNVGKSSLFNALIQSDFCKPGVIDFVQKATISQWPGTTLNLLKFPIMRHDHWKDNIRQNRLNKEAIASMPEMTEKQRMLRATKDTKFEVLTGKIGVTFMSREIHKDITKPDVVSDPFRYTKYPPRNIPKIGEWDPHEPTIQGKWCYDTPGVVNENQILDILTLPELMKTLPKSLLRPRTYFIKNGMSLFVGGLARIDYSDGIGPIRYTVYCSEHIPITIVQTVDADYFYKKALGSQVLGVPVGSSYRLSKFPSLSSTDFTLYGEGHCHSCGDIALSSAGWVAVTVGFQKTVQLRVHTPGGKGSFLRQPSILPYFITRKGPRIRGTLAYLPHRVYVPNKNAKY